MQDSYAGDVGDFGKFVMLDVICTSVAQRPRLGINWYTVSSPVILSNDGRHTGYLRPSYVKAHSFKACSPRIFDALSGLVASRKRSINGLESLRLLPSETRYFSDPLPPSKESRADWFESSMRSFRECDLVFLDPDNGIQPERLSPRERRSLKYAFVEEIAAYYQSGKSVIVYNHRDRSPKRRYDRKFRIVQQATALPDGMQVLRFKRYSVRDYLFLPQKSHRALFTRGISVLTSPPLDFLFERYIPDA